MKKLVKKYGHAWILSYVVAYLSWFCLLEKRVTSGFHIMHTKLDDIIPFCEYFILPYLIWFFYVALTVLYFFFTSKEDYYSLCAFLFTGMTISLLICTVFPNGTDLRISVSPDKNFCSWLVSLLHRVDSNANVFPSIHTFNSLGTHFAITNSKQFRNKPVICALSFLLMIAICLSTVYLKQHSIVDVLGAGVLAFVIHPFVYSGSYAENSTTVQNRRNVAH